MRPSRLAGTLYFLLFYRFAVLLADRQLAYDQLVNFQVPYASAAHGHAPDRYDPDGERTHRECACGECANGSSAHGYTSNCLALLYRVSAFAFASKHRFLLAILSFLAEVP